MWLRVLALALHRCPEALDKRRRDDLDAPPDLHLLLKDHRDQQDRGGQAVRRRCGPATAAG